MKYAKWYRRLAVLGSGALLLQAGGCTPDTFLNFVQTVLLGVTAAGAVAIIQNI